MRLTPYDVELQVPRFYRRERESKIRQVNEDIDRILDELGEAEITRRVPIISWSSDQEIRVVWVVGLKVRAGSLIDLRGHKSDRVGGTIRQGESVED